MHSDHQFSSMRTTSTKIIVESVFGNHVVPMELDTERSVSIVSEKLIGDLFTQKNTDIMLKSCSVNVTYLLGQLRIMVKHTRAHYL